MWMQSQLIRQNLLNAKKKNEGERIKKQYNDISLSDLKDVKGLGESTIKILFWEWITSQEELKKLSKEDVDNIIKNPLTKKSINNFLNNQ